MERTETHTKLNNGRNFNLPNDSRLKIGSLIPHRRTPSEIVVSISDGVVRTRDLTWLEEFLLDLKEEL
jgi:hypothetical protein